MKKVLTLVAAASMFTFVACGPSAEEKAAKEKATQDSIAAVEAAKVAEEAAKAQAAQDSINAVNAAKEAEAKRIADSTAEAEAKGKKTVKPVKPKTNEQHQKEVKKNLNNDRG
jgi:Skp family chaperone for outer membrane proteins